MICAITGHSGVLGSFLIKKAKKNIKFLKFKGNICNKNQISSWIIKNKFDSFIHLAAIVPTEKVRKNYYKAKKVNFYGTKFIVDALKKKKKKYGSFIHQVRMFTLVQIDLLKKIQN